MLLQQSIVAKQVAQTLALQYVTEKQGLNVWVAETKGFEPSNELPRYSLSRGAPSTTRPRLQ